MRNYFSKLNRVSSYKTPDVVLKKSGFTLVEALVAITILLIAVVGPLSLVSQSIQNANIAKDQITAFYLAQEAIEFVRNIRDSNFIVPVAPANWLDYPNLDLCKGGNSCEIDVNNSITPIATFSASDVFILATQGAHKIYTYTPPGGYTSVSTTFTRSVNIKDEPTNIGKEAIITVTMSWKTGIATKTFVITERIFNWN
jgi:prepilin-type N-terminal cleavage/methylation domain-containing protein